MFGGAVEGLGNLLESESCRVQPVGASVSVEHFPTLHSLKTIVSIRIRLHDTITCIQVETRLQVPDPSKST